MPKGSGKRAGSVKKSASFAGRMKATFSGIVNYVRRLGKLGGNVRAERNRRPKGTSGRAGGKTSRRIAQSGRGGR